MDISINIHNFLGREPRNKKEVTAIQVFSLPFRIEVGKEYRFKCAYENNLFDVWIYNEVPLVDNKDPRFIARHENNYAVLTSKVLVHYKNTEVLDYELDMIVAAVKSHDISTIALFPLKDIHHKTPILINRVLAACSAVSCRFFSGFAIKKIGWFDLEYGGLVLSTDVVIAPEGFYLENGQAEDIFRKYPIKLKYNHWASSGATPILTDILEAQKILDYFDQMLFYELLFDAKSKHLQGDHEGALIQTSNALENLIWLILDIDFRMRFLEVKNKLDEKQEKDLLSDKHIKEVIEYFGKELALTGLIETIPYLFLTDNDRPKPSEIKQAVKAISFRNKLIHSKKNKKTGTYYWQEHPKVNLWKHYSDLYAFVFKLGLSLRKKVMV